jgi:alpha-tubulin suppressor-like RCC1 family protein
VLVAGGLEFTTIVAGSIHACALTAQGPAYCWGEGGKGELGDGNSTDALAPVPVSGGLAFTSIATGMESSCGVTTGGAAYCWGDNFSGQLGTGTTGGASPVPLVVSGGLTFRGLAVLHSGFGAACGVTTTNAAYCWGEPYALGSESAQASPVPVLVERQ